MSGLLSPKFESRQLNVFKSEVDFEKEFQLLQVRMENASRIKKTLSFGNLNSSELALANFQISRLEKESQLTTRMESSQNLQENLKLRCEGIIDAALDFVLKIFKWISEKISSIFGGSGSGGNSSNEKKAEETSKRVEEKVEKAEKKKEETKEKSNSRKEEENQEEIKSEEEDKKKIKKDLINLYGDEKANEMLNNANLAAKDMFAKVFGKEYADNYFKNKNDQETKNKKPKLSLAEADKNFDVIMKPGPFFDYFLPDNKISYHNQLMNFRNNLRQIKKFTSEIKDLSNYLEKGDEIVEVFNKILSRNVNQHPFETINFPAGDAFVLFGSLHQATVMTVKEDLESKSLFSLKEIYGQLGSDKPADIKQDDQKLKVSLLLDIIKQTSEHYSEIEKYAKELEKISEESAKKYKSLLGSISEEKKKEFSKNGVRIARIYGFLTRELISYKGIDVVFKTIDNYIDVVEVS